MKKQQDLERQMSFVKDQEDEIKRQITVLQAEGEIKKARAVGELCLYTGPRNPKLKPREELDPPYSEGLEHPCDFIYVPRIDVIYKKVQNPEPNFEELSHLRSVTDGYDLLL